MRHISRFRDQSSACQPKRPTKPAVQNPFNKPPDITNSMKPLWTMDSLNNPRFSKLLFDTIRLAIEAALKQLFSPPTLPPVEEPPPPDTQDPVPPEDIIDEPEVPPEDIIEDPPVEDPPIDVTDPIADPEDIVPPEDIIEDPIDIEEPPITPEDPIPPEEPPTITPIGPVGQDADQWDMTFTDEFGDTQLENFWKTAFWHGRTNGRELQYYAPDAFEEHDGVLDIKPETRTVRVNGKDYPYTSGLITTQDHFSQKYGYFEMRAKIPKGQGMFPAFWLLEDGRGGDWRRPEIDVMENLGRDPNKIYFTNHWGYSDATHGQNSGSTRGPDYSEDFHTYGVKWEPDAITWYVDGEEKFRSTQNVPQNTMYLLANLAIGGTWGGPPDGSTQIEGNNMVIDYIRAFKRKEDDQA